MSAAPHDGRPEADRGAERRALGEDFEAFLRHHDYRVPTVRPWDRWAAAEGGRRRPTPPARGGAAER